MRTDGLLLENYASRPAQLRILSLQRNASDSHEFTDNTCGLIARTCPGLQELILDNHNQLSVRGIRKVFEGCPHLKAFLASTSKLSGEDVLSLLELPLS